MEIESFRIEAIQALCKEWDSRCIVSEVIRVPHGTPDDYSYMTVSTLIETYNTKSVDLDFLLALRDTAKASSIRVCASVSGRTESYDDHLFLSTSQLVIKIFF